jgi:CubicO group peptidase (beta-lactamase class C family)
MNKMNINSAFDEFLQEVKAKEMVINYVQVRHHGDIVLDWGRMAQKTRLNTWSVSKSFVSVAVGIAMDEGLIRLDEKICDSFKEYIPDNPSDNLLNITVRHMLTMTTGFDHALFFSDDPERYVTKDWIKYFFNSQFTYRPGERFLYCNFNTYMLACLIERKAGVPIMDYLQDKLFTPLDILSPDWTRCPMGHIHGANGLYLTIDEFGRFGQMLLDDGVYNGHTIVSKKYLDMAKIKQVPEEWENNYGFQFWMNPDRKSFRADGKFGQYIIVIKDADMVISVQSLSDGEVFKTVWEKFVEKII